MENGKQPNEEPKQSSIQKTTTKVSDVKSKSRSPSPIAAVIALGTAYVACVAPAETMNMVYGGAAACVMSSSSSGYVPHARGGYVADDSSDEESVFDVEEDSHPSLGERKCVEYDEEQLEDMKDDRNIFESQIKKMRRSKRYISYENQTSVAININNLFNNLSVVIQMVIGYTQSGKTGCMVELIDQMTKNESNPISVENIFVITGLSSIDWVKQTMERFPECIRHHVFHLGKLDDFKAAVAGKQNVLIIIDEAHMASKKKQTMSRIFKELNWKLDYMMKNDIKLVQFSATPDGLIFALNGPKWPEEHYKITTMKPGCSYFGAKQMNELKQLKQIKNIYGRNKKDGSWISDEFKEECLENISEILRDQLSFQEPRYLLVRIRGGIPEQAYHENFLEAIKSLTADKQEMFEKKFLHYNMRGNVTDISKQFHESPEKHTIVFIKEKLKCAQTLEYVVLDEKTGKTETHKVKHNIGVVVERLTLNDSFTIQGLLGRLCGYEEHDCICYTNLESFEKYEELFESNFDTEKLELVSWNSNTTLGRGDGRGTNVYPTVNDECVDDETSSSEVVVVDASAIHSTQAAAKSWAVEHLNLGALKTKTVSCVTEYNADKTKNTQNRGTHINPRNHFEPIPTEESIRAKHDLSLKFGGGVRIIPVRMPGDDAPNQYVVIYDKNWLKQQP